VSKSKKKSKNPNGILEWIVDFFVTPLGDSIGKILKPALDAIDKNRILAEAQKTTFEYRAGKPSPGKAFTGKSPITPDEAYKAAWGYVNAVEPGLLTMALSHLTIEAGSLGQVDFSLQGLAGLPSVMDDKQIALATRTAEFSEGAYPALRRYYLKKLTPFLPETYRLAIARAKGILPLEQYYEAMAESGLSQPWASVWEEQNYEYPAFAQQAELFWRGVIDDKTFTLWMQRTGAKPETIEALKKLMELIPPASDLVTMVVREAFDPKYVTPAPEVFAKYMAMKGFSKDWADRYWTMHWVPIPLTQAYANLHWGYWSKDDFLEALRIADVHPQWREDIYNVAFVPPSIRELGYGYDVGEYTFDDIMTYRRRGGLSEGDALKAAKSMIAYRTEAEREAVRREHMHLFALGKEDEETFRDNLERLGTNRPALELWVERAKLEMDRTKEPPKELEYRTVTGTEALWAFENGLITEDVTRKNLASLNWTTERIDLSIRRSKWEMEQKRIKEAAPTYRELSISQVRDLYKAGKIEAEQVPGLLIALKYRKEEAEILGQSIVAEVDAERLPRKLSVTEATRLYDFRLLGIPELEAEKSLTAIFQAEGARSPAKALFEFYLSLNYEPYHAVLLTLWTIINLNLPDIRAMYSKGWITATVMVNEFVRLGLPIDRANEIAMTIVKAEQPERTKTEKDLTKAEIIKGVKIGVLSPAQGSELLQGIGYDASEAMYLLYINAVVARGDPEGYWEMRKIIEQGKKARGEKYAEIPDEIVTLELQIKDKKAGIEKLKAERAPEEAIGEAVLALSALEQRMKTLVLAYKLS